MNLFKSLLVLMMLVIISACSTTNKITYSEFKRPLTNDYALAVSLLNRPIPQDQRMMLAFVEQQTQQYGSFHYVSIIGDKESSPAPENTSNLYTLTYNDNNATSLVGE